jgi:hypothetical protein
MLFCPGTEQLGRVNVAHNEVAIGQNSFLFGRIASETRQPDEFHQRPTISSPNNTRKTKINQRTVSKISNMPPSMLNILDEAQIFDLLAYLISDGDSAHAAFRRSGLADGRVWFSAINDRSLPAT